VLVGYAFHNRTDQAGSAAIGGLYMLLPLAMRLDSYRSLAELYDDVKAQSIGNVQHGNHNWQDLIVPGRLQEVFSLFYETNRIMGSARALKELGMSELPVEYSESVLSPNHLSGVVIDTSETFNLAALYQSNLYEQGTAQKFVNCFDAFASVLASVESPSRVTVSDVMKRADEILAQIPEPTGGAGSGKLTKRLLMSD